MQLSSNWCRLNVLICRENLPASSLEKSSRSLMMTIMSAPDCFMVSPLFLILAAVVLFLLILIFAVLPMASMVKLLQLHVEENHRPKKQTPKTSLVLDCSHRSFSKVMAGKYYRHSFRMYIDFFFERIPSSEPGSC